MRRSPVPGEHAIRRREGNRSPASSSMGGQGLNTRRLLISLVVLLALVTALSAPVLAKDYSGTETVARDSYFSKSVSVKATFLGTIQYTVTVSSGPNVDVYLFDQSNFDKFVANTTFDPAADDLNVLTATQTYFYSSDATYYLVIDNSNRGTPLPANPPVPA